jgi:suppressor for copper-sensitivity B
MHPQNHPHSSPLPKWPRWFYKLGVLALTLISLEVYGDDAPAKAFLEQTPKGPTLHIELQPNWHIYAPGTPMGMAPTLKLNQSITPQWPTPHAEDHKNFLYTNSIQVPLQAHDATSLWGKISYVACHKICILIEQELSLGTLTWYMAFIAFLGGLILNVMPCVLPILSLKVFSVLQKKDHTNKKIRYGFLSSIGGSFLFFTLITIVTLLLKTMGGIVGWGLHFQEPYFIIFLSLIMTIFLASMWGAHEIGHGLLRWFHLSPKNNQYVEDFLLGFMAALMATPCSAPFLGTAVAFALTQSAWITVATFAILWLGFAFPMILLVLWPKWMNVFPKPGRWMKRAQKILGGFLLLTILWLLWILALQSNILQTILVSLCLGGFYFVLWKGKGRRKTILGALLVAFTIALPMMLPTVDSTVNDQDVFAQIEQDRQQGNTVFVAVSAAWCMTCQTNHMLVLDRKGTKDLFAKNNVKYYYLDWTNRSTTIGAFLKQHGRAGIPFYLVYGPKEPKGIVLPELLTLKTVEEALGKVGSQKQFG